MLPGGSRALRCELLWVGWGARGWLPGPTPNAACQRAAGRPSPSSTSLGPALLGQQTCGVAPVAFESLEPASQLPAPWANGLSTESPEGRCLDDTAMADVLFGLLTCPKSFKATWCIAGAQRTFAELLGERRRREETGLHNDPTVVSWLPKQRVSLRSLW